jgi:hypothetical protein
MTITGSMAVPQTYNPSLSRPWQNHLNLLAEHLAPEDIAFVNARGVQGAPLADGERFLSLAKRIYADADGHMRPVAYYDHQLAKQNEAGIESLRFMLKQEVFGPEAEANMQQTLDSLLSVRQAPRQQMASVLEDAKLTLAQRGVDGEAQVAEAIGVIDAVLHNMQGYANAGTSEQSLKFMDLYSKEVKKACELAAAKGRDPFPLLDKLPDDASASKALFDRAWKQAVESVRPQARTMAEALKNILTPYAEMSPPSNGEAGDAGGDKTQRRNSWELV